MLGKYLQNYLMLTLAIGFICVMIFPIVFLYGLSLFVEGFVGKKFAASIESFWDKVGKPYNYLIRHVE
jgi:hypothetical protein